MRAARPPSLRAAVSRANITPSIGVDLVGFAGRGPSTGLGDELHATALAFSDGRTRAAVVHLDLIGLDAGWASDACRLIEAQARVPASHVVLCCTHTHYGPAVSRFAEDPHTSPEAAYMAELRFKLAGLVQDAAGRLEPVAASVGRSTSDIGINRRERLGDGRIILGRNPDGPIDREAIVVRLDRRSGEPLACLLNFATHPVSQTHTGRLISADFPGYARQTVEALTGATCLFLQGASGDINSAIMREGLASPRTLGRRLGAAFVQAYETAQPVAAAPLGVARRDVRLQAGTFSSVDEAERKVAALEAQLAEAESRRVARNLLDWTRSRLERARAALESLRGGKRLPPVVAPVWGLVLGDIGLATGPGEIFCEIGLAVKRAAVVPHTLYVSNTNGSIGYVPMPDAYADGGYEVEMASRVGPEAAPALVAATIRTLREARRRSRRELRAR
jgi:hypothetical protein